MNLKKILGIICIVMAVLCLVSTQVKTAVYNIDDSEYSVEGNAGIIKNDTVIEYVYSASGDTVAGYEFMFATYGKKPTSGRILLDVFDDDTNELLGSGSVKAERIEDNEMVLIKTKRIKTGDRKIRLVISAGDLKNDEKITLWLGKNDENKKSVTLIDGDREEDNLLVFSRIESKQAPYVWDMVLITAICFAVYCSALKPEEEENSESDIEIIDNGQTEDIDGAQEETD